MVECAIRDFKIHCTIDEYRKNIGENVHDKQVDFCKGLLDKLYNDSDNKIYVNSNRCGMGKSTLVKAFLHNLVNNYMYFGKASRDKELDYYGAIVIHDSLEGLENIIKYDGLKDRCYFIRYDKEEENSKSVNNARVEFNKQLEEQWAYPIVLITTQKYFKMTPQERNRLYSWKKGKREIKIIDEKPYIISTTT